MLGIRGLGLLHPRCLLILKCLLLLLLFAPVFGVQEGGRINKYLGRWHLLLPSLASSGSLCLHGVEIELLRIAGFYREPKTLVRH